MKAAKDKAKELIGKFDNELGSYQGFNHSTQCALICVEEMISRFQNIPDIYCLGSIIIDEIQYWEDVAQELKKAEI